MRAAALLLLFLASCSSAESSPLRSSSSSSSRAQSGASTAAASEGASAPSAPVLTPSATTGASAAPSSSPAAPSASCVRAPRCEPKELQVDAAGFRHRRHKALTKIAAPNHRGIDLLLGPGDEQIVFAKMVYGELDKDLEDEDVELWVLRGCAGDWEKLGEARTTGDDAPASKSGEPGGGGRVRFDIPADKRLGVGLHPVRVVARGDGSTAELSVLVSDGKLAMAVSDVDGTLTGSEVEEFEKLVKGDLPTAHPDAAEAIGALREKGYLPVYLTARPEWLVNRTRAFLRERGFPSGLVQTTQTKTGYLGSAAGNWKALALAELGKHGEVRFGFGNMPGDAAAYERALPDKGRRLLFQLSDDRATRFDSYTDLLPMLRAAPACD